MAMSFNPKKIALDIANGVMSLNPTILKRYLPDDLKTLLSQLTAEQRKTRATQVPKENTQESNARNRRLQNLNQAIMMINAYLKKLRLRP